MANQLKMATVQFILELHAQGWSGRRIARELGVDRETVSRYVAGSNPANAPITRAGESALSNPANAPIRVAGRSQQLCGLAGDHSVQAPAAAECAADPPGSG